MKISVKLLARWPILVLGVLIICSTNLMAENIDNGGEGNIINSVPREMTFQGILKDSGGDPVADTTVDVTFRIYDDEFSGTLEWNQSLGITTDGSGIFNAVLGNLNIPFDEVYWLEIQIDTEPNPMSPRQKLRLSAYAARTDTSDYALNSTPDSDWVFSGDDLHSGVSGNVGIGITSPAYKLHVLGDFFANTVNTGQGNNKLYEMNQNVQTTDSPTFNNLALSRAYISDYGYAIGGFHVGSSSDPGTGNLIVDDDVGIGTNTPSYPLHVSTTRDRAGYFTSSYPGSLNHTVHAQTTSVSAGDSKAVYGESTPADWYGYGGYFKGGYMGVYASVSPTGSNNYYGVYGTVSGGTGINYGVFGQAAGAGDNYAVYYSGGLAGTGTKSCIVKTSQGPTLLYCQESPENWFEDFGDGRLVNGTAHIDLDPLYLETVTIDDDHRMKVFVQLEGDCNGVYVSKGSTGFDIIELNKGTSNAPFSYRVVAKRKGFETRRLDYTAAAENDTYLYPEKTAEIEKKRTE